MADQPGTAPPRRRAVGAPVDVYEVEAGIVVVADLPGVDPSALDVGLEGRILTIHGTPRTLATGESIHREFELNDFFRQLRLPIDVDPDAIAAELRDGVLTVRLARLARPARSPSRPPAGGGGG